MRTNVAVCVRVRVYADYGAGKGGGEGCWRETDGVASNLKISIIAGWMFLILEKCVRTCARALASRSMGFYEYAPHTRYLTIARARALCSFALPRAGREGSDEESTRATPRSEIGESGHVCGS